MATKITCIVPDGVDQGSRIDEVGGDGWEKPVDS